jgi:ankyrin repeat protein
MIFYYVANVQDFWIFREFPWSSGIRKTAENNLAIRGASYFGHLEVVKFLASQLTKEDLRAKDNEAISIALKRGYINVVKFLATQLDKEDLIKKRIVFLFVE